MHSIRPFLSSAGSVEETSFRLRRRLGQLGPRVLQTFDIGNARHAASDCPCPHHGDTACDCSMLILLIYLDAGAPITVILHGNGGRTWLSMVETAGQQAQGSLQLAIQQTLETYPA